MSEGSTNSEYGSSSVRSAPAGRSEDHNLFHPGIPAPFDPIDIREIGAPHNNVQMPIGDLDMDLELDILLPEIENAPAETEERIHHRRDLQNFLGDSDSLFYLQPVGRNDVHPRDLQTEPHTRSTSQSTTLSLSEDIEKRHPGFQLRRNSTHARYLAVTTVMTLAVGSFVLLRSYRTIISLITNCGLALLFEGLGLFFLLAAFYWTFF